MAIKFGTIVENIGRVGSWNTCLPDYAGYVFDPKWSRWFTLVNILKKRAAGNRAGSQNGHYLFLNMLIWLGVSSSCLGKRSPI